MADESSTRKLPNARVVTTRRTGGVSNERRVLFQRHLLLFLLVGGGAGAADVMTTPGLQWAYYIWVIWGMVFLVHFFGLLSRGFGLGELFLPPRSDAPREEMDPLAYELVRARQLRDGAANAAAAARGLAGDFAESARSAADELAGVVEELVQAVHERDDIDDAEAAERLEPRLRAALDALDDLHEALLDVSVMDAEPDPSVIEEARARTGELRSAKGELGG